MKVPSPTPCELCGARRFYRRPPPRCRRCYHAIRRALLAERRRAELVGALIGQAALELETRP